MAAKKTATATVSRKSASAKSAAPKQRTDATPRSSSRKSPKAGDELVTIDRRRNEESAPAPALTVLAVSYGGRQQGVPPREDSETTRPREAIENLESISHTRRADILAAS